MFLCTTFLKFSLNQSTLTYLYKQVDCIICILRVFIIHNLLAGINHNLLYLCSIFPSNSNKKMYAFI